MTQRPGIYVHIPFCLRRCDYCDFTTFADRDQAIPAYVDALCRHIAGSGSSRLARLGARSGPSAAIADFGRDSTMGEGRGHVFGSVFVGGGTPTYLPPADLTRIIRTIANTFDVTVDAEWTVEANPETVTEVMAAALADAGINRVSLGAQSFDDRVLTTLGRWHDPDSVHTAITRLTQAGIPRLSLDLIYGTPGETDASWQRSLDVTVATGVRHISAYALTVEPNTPYAARVRTEPALEPDEDIQATRMAMADQTLGLAGLHRYEVSNWAQPGQESRHNLTYWRGGDWLAFGSGAHGAWQGRRYWLVRDPDRYARMVQEGSEPLAGDEILDADQIRLERLMMGLRLVEGVPSAEVQPLDPDTMTRLISRGLMTMRDGNRVALTTLGMPMAGAVIRELA
ncbi:MAG: radical SAM family heme chaperone HemW [Euzebya sp.]